jgi:hypothetical protein
MQQDLQRRAELSKAQKVADDGDSLGTKAADIGAKVLLASPFNTGSGRKPSDVTAAADARDAERKRKLSEAQDAADYKDVRPDDSNTGFGKRYPDVNPGPMYKKGGIVKSKRGWGKARGG